MTERIAINADLDFVQGLLKDGAGDLKYCYQCSTCTVACPATPDGSPFPRKEMIHAQWGLKDRLLKSMDAWLCLNCNDCSTHCPRGANPGDVMAVIRSKAVQHFSTPGFIARAANTPSKIWMLFLIPMAIIGAVIFAINAPSGFAFLSGDIVFSRMLPVPVVDAIFIPTFAFAAITAMLGLKRFIAGLKEEHPANGRGQGLIPATVGTLVDILTHKPFRECGTNHSRSNAHMLTMYGFLGLGLTTTLVAIVYYLDKFGFQVDVTPLPFANPIKILGNVSGLLALTGILLVLMRRLSSKEGGVTVSFDMIFILVILLTVLSGFLAQATRVMNLASLAYFIYYAHLVFVFFLLAYAPHTKFAHIFYRTAAMIYHRMSGRSAPQEG